MNSCPTMAAPPFRIHGVWLLSILHCALLSNVHSFPSNVAVSERMVLRHLHHYPFAVFSCYQRQTKSTPSSALVSATRLQQATSSRDLQDKKRGPRKTNTVIVQAHKEDETSVVQRLSKAIAQARSNKIASQLANATKNEVGSDDRNTRKQSPTADAASKSSKLGTLRQLNEEIDIQLNAAKGPRRDQLIAGMAGSQLVLQPRDSMSALLEHNDKMNARTVIAGPAFNTTAPTSWPTRHVAVVFSKPLVDNQVTLEYASRIRAIAKAMQQDLYRPSLLCFTGGVSPPNAVADADAGFLFFRHLCASQRIPLTDVEFILDRTSTWSGGADANEYQSRDESKSLTHIIQRIQQQWLSRWFDEAFKLNYDLEPSNVSKSDSEGAPLSIRAAVERTKKLVIHFTLVSTEYHLCNLNDIHHRSPRQSLLRPLATSFATEHFHLASESTVQVEIIWSYRYSTYPSLYFARDEANAFMGKCYRHGEELVPLLVNMKGVVDSMEFFQRDNYLVLISVRRALVKDLEALYGSSSVTSKSSLKQSLKRIVPQHSLVTGLESAAPLEVVLESAVLSIGRCLDLVRPAGQLKGAVSKVDWIKAVKALEHAMKQIRQACDPDGPLDPAEWGRFSRSDNHNVEDYPHDYDVANMDGGDFDELFEKSSEYDGLLIKLVVEDSEVDRHSESGTDMEESN